MTTSASTVIVSFSVQGMQGVTDVEIPDDKGLFETATLLIDAIGLADMNAHRIKELEVIEPLSIQPKILRMSQTALGADIRDGAWIIAHLERQTILPTAATLPAAPTPVAPTPTTSSQSITFQRRELSHGSSLTREETNQ